MLGADGKVRVLKLQRKTNTDPEKLPVRTIHRLPNAFLYCLLFAHPFRVALIDVDCMRAAVASMQWKMSPASRALATSSVASLFDPNRLFSPPRKRVSETVVAADWSAR